MADLPVSNNSFADYYAQYRSQFAAQQNTPSEPIDYSKYSEIFKGKEPQKLGFLGRTVDILSRPLRLVSNPVMKALELPEKYKALAEEEAAGGEVSFGEKLAPVGSLIAAPFTGFFSDDPDNKPYWSDIIEQIEDVSNINNPNYVDTENNADPVVKGVVGFIGDVALDPLSWIPGVGFIKAGVRTQAALSKAGQVAGRAAEKVGIRRPATPTDELAEQVFDVTIIDSKGTKVQTFDTLDEANAFVQQKRARSRRTFKELAEGETPVRGVNGYRITPRATAAREIVEQGSSNPVPAAQAATKVTKAVDEAVDTGETATEAASRSIYDFIDEAKTADGTPMRGAALQFLQELAQPVVVAREVAKQAAAKAPKAVKAKAPSFAEWRKTTAEQIRSGQLEDMPVQPPSEIGRAIYNRSDLSQLRNIRTMGQALRLFEQNRYLQAAIKEDILDGAYNSYVKSVSAGKATDFVGRKLQPDEMAEAAAVRQVDEVKDAAPKSTKTAAIYAKGREVYGKFRDQWIAKNKKRLGLTPIKHDFTKTQVSPRAPEMARVYAELVSDPTNPVVREAYEAFVKESREQYEYLTKELGIEVEFVDYDPYNVIGKDGTPVPDSRSMIEDVVNNKHLFVRDSAQDFATDPHPIMSVEENNIFRAVHEFFGHAASGSSFSAAGEEGAWISHSAMFSQLARRVMTTETRGQNSYYNFLDPSRKQFAPQKAALFPEEFTVPPTPAETAQAAQGVSVLSTLEKLQALEFEAAAKAEAIFGEKLLADLSRMSDSKLSILLDELQTILKGSGVVPIWGNVGKTSVRAQILKRFNLTPDVLAQARAGVDGQIDRIPFTPKQTLDEAVDTLEENGLFTERFRDHLAAGRFDTPEFYRFGIEAIRRAYSRAAKELFDEKGLIKQGYTSVSKDGTLRTDPLFGVGVGRKLLAMNTHAQYTFYRELAKEVDDIFVGTLKTKNGKPVIDKDGNPVRNLNAKYVEPGTGKPIPIGTKLGETKLDFLTAIMRGTETFLESKGVPIVIDDAVDGTIVALRGSDILEGLRAGFRSNAEDLGLDPAREERWLELLFTNPNTGAAFTKIVDAVSAAFKGGTTDDILRIVSDNTRRNLSAAPGTKPETISNWLASDAVDGLYGHRAFGPRQKKVVPEAPPGVRYERNGDKGYYVYYNREVAAAKLADAIMASRSALQTLSEYRSSLYSARIGEEIAQTTPLIAENLVRMAKTYSTAGAAIKAAANIGDMNKDFGRVINAMEASVVASTAATRQALGLPVQNIAKNMDDMAEAVVADNPAGVKAAKKKLMEESEGVRESYQEGAEKIVRNGADAADDAQTRALKEEVGEQITDEKASTSFRKEESEGFASIMSIIKALIAPLNRALNGKYGMNTKEFLWGWTTFHGQGKLLREAVYRRVNHLKVLNEPRFARTLDDKGTTVLKQAFEYLRTGAKLPDSVDPDILAAYEELGKHMGEIFALNPTTGLQILSNQFFRTGAGLEYINDTFGRYRVLGANKTPPNELYIDIDKAIKDAATKGTNKWVEAANQWRTWDIDDPIDFLSRLDAAALRMAADVGFVEKFTLKAEKLGLVAKKAQEGFVKLAPDEKSYFGRLIGQDVYVPEDVAEMFYAIDKAMGTSKALTSEFGKFINRTIDPITNTWKYTITLPRPGHHVRNMFGDLSFTYFAQGARYYTKSARDAFRVLGLRNEYQDVDIIRALSIEGLPMPKQTDVMSSGYFGKITSGQIFEAARLRGLMPPARVIEDLYDEDIIASTFGRTLEKVGGVVTLGAGARGGRAEQIVMNVSEYRDHYARMQHFLQYIYQAQDGKDMVRTIGRSVGKRHFAKVRAQFKKANPKATQAEVDQAVLNELFDLAAERVMKFHPDVSQLSAFETKYVRRIIPFYSWTRGAVVALGETLVTAPGRLQVLNKASYNIAIASGIDPNSLYDPFPDDQLFPSFLRDEMQGPQFEAGGRYYGLSPGIASWDVFNMLGPDPIRGVVGATNPLLRAPIELLAGSSLGTGARIRDYSDYVDSSIPGVNYLSSITGTSISGSLASLLTGGGFDPQYQYAAGNKETRDKFISFFNYLTGLGLKDYSRPNYINYAEIELRNEAARKAGER